MREVFAPSSEPRDPSSVFYTIRPEDVGKTVIQTTVGPIRVTDVMGRVMKHDVGKRIYRTPTYDSDYWFWQVENEAQFHQRIGGM